MPDRDISVEHNWAFVTGEPQLTASIKHSPEDFVVEEQLGFEPDGRGEHLFLRLQKRNLTTTEVATTLATTLGLRRVDVGYAGMKDRRAQTCQWFSVLLPTSRESQLVNLESNDLKVLETRRNGRKLKIGAHEGNRFELRLRNIVGDRQVLEKKLEWLHHYGVPNYFGQQRFGRDLSSLHQVRQLLMAADNRTVAQGNSILGRQKRSLLYSAARSYLFNQLLSARVKEQCWNRYIEGDVLALDGSKRLFTVEPGKWDDKLQNRLARLDIHLTGCLAGYRENNQYYETCGSAADMEKRVLADYPDLLSGLVRHGLRAGRRTLRFRLRELTWKWPVENELKLEVTLPAGAYATSLLRELCRESPAVADEEATGRVVGR
ncbi:MAG: tRNA pseudouridine(13) synthase TruD [Gammaproteobacteria bacterium]|nr:tRNA pseudouridine(13) synthase TruD [Gammaproteobacteria bacterium]MCY4357232.1 tRNA pseudouridine(13) synthase TruD [Gammaproteobacteria bacterium]